MKIVIVHQDLFFQGGQCVAAKLANGLHQLGHSVDVVVSKVHTDIQNEHPDAKPFPLEADIGFHVLPNRQASRNVFALARLLRKLQPDVIMPNVGHYNQCAVLARIVGRLRMPIVYVEHCACGGAKPKNLSDHFRRWILRQDEKIVAVSDAVRDGVKCSSGLGDDRVLRIYNPTLSHSENVKVDESRIHPWLLDPNVFKIVSAGALSPGKGFDSLIRSFALVKARLPKAKLVIFGRGCEHDALQRQISEMGFEKDVSLAGFTDCLRAQMTKADVFAFASRFETFSIVLVEALASGCKIVSTDCPVGPREVLHGGALGQLVPVDNAESMADAIMNVYAGQWRPAEQFDPHEYLESTAIDHYEQLLKTVV